jgi:hypothetical protein
MTETFEKTFTVAASSRLSINNIRGSVEIAPGDEGVIQITAVKHSHSGDEKRTQIEISQEADGTVKAATHYPDGDWTWMFGSQPCEVDYVVRAPRDCSLKLNGVSNSVRVEGFEGEVNINSVSGEITLRDLNGSVRIHSVSGDTDGEKLGGALVVDTVSGDVYLKECSLPSIHGKTVSGDIQISTPLASGPYDFKSVSGDVRLNLPPNTQCSGELNTLSGDLISAFPISGSSSHHGSQSVNIQGGGVRITLNSVSGDLSLDTNGEIFSSPNLSSSITSEERRNVLERVERGDLSVEQALGILQA